MFLLLWNKQGIKLYFQVEVISGCTHSNITWAFKLVKAHILSALSVVIYSYGLPGRDIGTIISFVASSSRSPDVCVRTRTAFVHSTNCPSREKEVPIVLHSCTREEIIVLHYLRRIISCFLRCRIRAKIMYGKYGKHERVMRLIHVPRELTTKSKRWILHFITN